MPRFQPEPPDLLKAAPKIGVVLVNLGTPDAPTPAALRRYLKEFLWDPRVVEIPRAIWWLILHAIILTLRPAKSAKKYAAIWLKDGSPLALHTAKQSKLLRGALGVYGYPDVEVAYAMRYGNPSIPSVLDALKQRGCQRILVVPAFPQYAAATTASISDKLGQWSQRIRNLPELRLLRSYHNDANYIAALAASVRDYWMKNGRPDKLVMSFHGLPQYTVEKGDPYFQQCQESGTLLAAALGLKSEQYLITFQSRFGKAEWLQPYTQPTLELLGKKGIPRVDVICPGFVADCLETLEEIGMECKAAFLSQGGKEFHYIPCLNERADWIDALSKLVQREMGSWLADSSK